MDRGAKKQIVIIDLVRFLAAVIVLLAHLDFSIAIVGSGPNVLSYGEVTTSWFKHLSYYGWIGVQIFFVISGIVISYSSKGATPDRFFRSRFLRLVPSVWICATLTLLFTLAHRGRLPGDLRFYLNSVLFLPLEPYIDASYWTLAVEVCFYVCIGFILYKKREPYLFKYMQWLVFASAVYWVIYSILHTFTRHGSMMDGPLFDRISQLLLLQHGAFFVLGVLLSKVLIENDHRRLVPILMVILSVCCTQIYWYNRVRASPYLPESGALPAIFIWAAGVATMVVGIQFNEILSSHRRIAKGLRIAGLMTYPLYLLHQHIGAVVTSRLIETGLEQNTARLLAIAFCFALTYVVVAFLEPPLRKAISRVFDADWFPFRSARHVDSARPMMS
jgi:exopolysaccharide production protein ExoZ